MLLVCLRVILLCCFVSVSIQVLVFGRVENQCCNPYKKLRETIIIEPSVKGNFDEIGFSDLNWLVSQTNNKQSFEALI